MENKFSITFLLSLFFFNCLNSQVFTNSAGNGIFYTEKAKQFKTETKVSKKSTEFNFQFTTPAKIPKPIKYFKKTGIDTVYTVETSYGWLFKLGMVNDQNFTEGIKNPGFNLEVGFLKGLDSINRKELRIWGYSWGIRGKLQYDNKKVLYDPIMQKRSNEYPYELSINTHFECYISNLDALAFGLTFGYVNSTNYNDLDSFQELPIEFQDSNIASIGDQAGKIGMLEPTNNLYLSFAMPIFPFKKTALNDKNKKLSRNIIEKIALTPFIHYLFLDSNVLNPGLSISLVNQALNSSRYEALFDSGFSFGVDWSRKDGKWTSPVYFIGGTLSIDGIIKDLKKEDDKSRESKFFGL